HRNSPGYSAFGTRLDETARRGAVSEEQAGVRRGGERVRAERSTRTVEHDPRAPAGDLAYPVGPALLGVVDGRGRAESGGERELVGSARGGDHLGPGRDGQLG